MSAFSKYYTPPESNRGNWSMDSREDRTTMKPPPNNVTPCLYDEVLFMAMLSLRGKVTVEESISMLKERLEVTEEQAKEIHEEAIQHSSIKDKKPND